MLAGLPVPDDAVDGLAELVRAAGDTELADRLDRALDDQATHFAMTVDDRAIVLNALDDPPEGLSELRAVLLNEHEWRQRTAGRT